MSLISLLNITPCGLIKVWLSAGARTSGQGKLGQILVGHQHMASVEARDYNKGLGGVQEQSPWSNRGLGQRPQKLKAFLHSAVFKEQLDSTLFGYIIISYHNVQL